MSSAGKKLARFKHASFFYMKLSQRLLNANKRIYIVYT